jgi:hypothetical protein
MGAEAIHINNREFKVVGAEGKGGGDGELINGMGEKFE